ncbi:MAG: hypothetical protein AB7S48_02935 [Bacteroidales bacterium]
MKTKDNITYKKLLFEFVSISFAIFLGLMLNQWKENYDNKKLVKQSLENILVEVKNNSARVQEMLDSHQVILSKIENILIHVDQGKIPSESIGELSFQLINSTAWETAKLTQAIAHMDINTVSEIARVYEFQEYYRAFVKQHTLNSISNKSFESEKDIRTNKMIFADLRDFLKTKIVYSETNLLENYNTLQKDLANKIK